MNRPGGRFEVETDAEGTPRRAYDRVLGRWLRLRARDSVGTEPGQPAMILHVRDSELVAYPECDTPGGGISSRSTRSGFRRLWLVLAAVALVALAMATAWWIQVGRWTSEPLSVALLVDTGTSGLTEGAGWSTGAAVESGAIEALANLEGVYAIAGRDVAAVAADPTSTALAVGAGEVLILQVDGAGGQLGAVDARLLDASGATLWADQFAVPDDAPLLGAEATRLRVRSAFPGRRMRWKPYRAVSPKLFSELLTLRAQIRSGAVTYEEALETARRLRSRHGSPEEAARIEVLLASYLFKSLGDRRYLEDAKDALSALESRELDPRAVVARADFALASRDLDSLREANLSLASLAPQHPYLARFRARAEQLAGRPDAGLRILREAVARVPRWFDLLALADLELRCGQPLMAREHLEAAGRLAPQVAQVTTKNCEVELTYGSPMTAERLLLQMISKLPQGHYSVNLGIARLLQLRVDEAQKAFHIARILGCRLALLRVYEADAALLQGRLDEARALYGTAIKELQQPMRAPDPFDRLNLAYCQARTGSCKRAIQTLREALTSIDASPHVAFSAMMVNRLCDDEAEAARYEEIARRDGLSEPWFRLAGALLAAPDRGAGGA